MIYNSEILCVSFLRVLFVPRVPGVDFRRRSQIDAVLIANPLNGSGRQHLAALLHAKSGKVLCVLVEPTTEGVAAYSSRFCQLIFVHCFHATKVLIFCDLCKFFARFLRQ